MKKILFFILAFNVNGNDSDQCISNNITDSRVYVANELVSHIESETFDLGQNYLIQVSSYEVGREIGFRYVSNMLTHAECDKLVSTCDNRNGWTRSPQRMADDTGTTQENGARTSSSCPMIWPLFYLPMLEKIRAANKLTPAIEDELMFVWDLTKRISTLFNVEEPHVEPLQVLRYYPGEFYRTHHDHGQYYGVETERRLHTLLIFLSDVPEKDGGGHTAFPLLGLKVLPKKGDAILWTNVNADGAAEELALHEAIAANSSVKYACNIWIAEKPYQKVDSSAYRTH